MHQLRWQQTAQQRRAAQQAQPALQGGGLWDRLTALCKRGEGRISPLEMVAADGRLAACSAN